MNISITQIIFFVIIYLILFGDLKVLKRKINRLYKILKKNF